MTLLAVALAATLHATCPNPAFVPHDGALRFSTTDLEVSSKLAVKRALTTSLPFAGQLGIGFAVEEELRVEVLEGGALRVTVPGPCPACASAVPEPSPDAMAAGLGRAARTLEASGVSALASEARAYADSLAADPVLCASTWMARRDAWLAEARREPADGLERLPVAARYRVVRLPSGSFLRYADAFEVQELDASGRLRRVVDAAGLVREVVRDAQERIVGFADGKGHTISFELDARGRFIAAVGSNGARVTYAYDAGGHLVSADDAGGRTEYGWDSSGRPVRMTCGGRTVAAEYEAAAQSGRVTRLDLGYVRERYVYGAAAGGLVRSVSVLEDEDASELSVDVAGPRERRHYTYIEPLTSDGRRFTWQATEEEGDTVRVTTYDARTFQPAVVAEGNEVARFVHDDEGRVVRKESSDQVTVLTYAPSGKVASVTRTDPSTPGATGVTVRYTYDDHGQLVAAGDASRSVEIAYDPRGRIATVVVKGEGEAQHVSYGYDEQDQVVRIEAENVGVVTVVRDAAGEIQKVDSEGGRKVSLQVISSMNVLLDLIHAAEVKEAAR
jgi:YD repeat-containing protein